MGVGADADAVAACLGQPDLTMCLDDGVCADQICVAAGCGNGIVEGDEACDDGNQVSGDGCSRGCDSLEACGNGVVDEPVEDCDDQNTDENDNCHSDCRFPRCGDGVVDTRLGEACDAGAANSNAAPDALCRESCQPPSCGDGTMDVGLGELCDDGNRVSGDGCRSDCRSTGTCGNGILDGNEACDDGNPGITVLLQITGLGVVEVYVAQRNEATLRSDSLGDDRIAGALDTARFEQTTLGASNPLFGGATTPVVNPDDTRFTLVRVAAGATCDDVLAQDETTLFGPR